LTRGKQIERVLSRFAIDVKTARSIDVWAGFVEKFGNCASLEERVLAQTAGLG